MDRRGRLTPAARFTAGAALFLAGAVASIVLLNDVNDGNFWVLLATQLPGAFVLGWLLHSGWRWAAPCLALAPALIAVPFGFGDSTGEAPIWFIELMLVAPASLVVMILGGAARALIDSHRVDRGAGAGNRRRGRTRSGARG